jgi:hypothetical protein
MRLWLGLEAGCILLGGLVVLLMPHVPPPAPIELHPLIPERYVNLISIIYLLGLVLILMFQIVIPAYHATLDSEWMFRRRVNKILKSRGLEYQWSEQRIIVRNLTEREAEATRQELRKKNLL